MNKGSKPILDSGSKILEPEIVDKLLPDLIVELVEVGQSKGKFGGGKRVSGNDTEKNFRRKYNKILGIHQVETRWIYWVGFGGQKTVLQEKKAIELQKLNIVKIRRIMGM